MPVNFFFPDYDLFAQNSNKCSRTVFVVGVELMVKLYNASFVVVSMKVRCKLMEFSSVLLH